MSSFDDVRFPTDVSLGARGGPRRRTQIVELASGREERNASWADSRREYDVSYGVRDPAAFAALVAFFEARNGRLRSFRFKDWSDYRSGHVNKQPGAEDQQLGLGDGATTEFQIVKSYESGERAYSREITKPVEGTVLVALDGAEQSTGWDVDTTTGVVTFNAAPGVGVVVTAGFEFDVPVRFERDQLDVTLELRELGEIGAVTLVEVRE